MVCGHVTMCDLGPSYFNQPNLENLSQASSGVCWLDDSRSPLVGLGELVERVGQRT